MSVVVVADSASDLPTELASELAIEVVPLTIEVAGRDWLDGSQLPREDFWRLQAQQATLPRTSAPSVAQFADTFRAALSRGASGVVCITLSQKLSATFQAAQQAALEVGKAVRVVDSETLTLTEGLIVEEAARAARAGADLDAVEAVAVRARARARTRGTLDTLENLRRGGRIGAAAALLGTVMAFKPMITIEEGEVRPGGRQRTRRRALDDLVEWVRQLGAVARVGVVHALAHDVGAFAERIADASSTPVSEVRVSVMGATIGTHAGPGALGVCVLLRGE